MITVSDWLAGRPTLTNGRALLFHENEAIAAYSEGLQAPPEPQGGRQEAVEEVHLQGIVDEAPKLVGPVAVADFLEVQELAQFIDDFSEHKLLIL